MLSTAPPILGITKDDGKSKLGIYKVYDFTKGGTDIIDQRMGFYTCKPKSRKWIFALQNKYDPCKQDCFEYCYTLLYQLVIIASVSKTIYTITKFEWPYYTCETKDRVGNRKKAMRSGR